AAAQGVRAITTAPLACRVGKGGGNTFRRDKAYRAPCPPRNSTRAAPSLVGTAHASPYSIGMPCQRLCPPYSAVPRSSRHSRQLQIEQHIPGDQINQLRDALAGLAVGEQEWLAATHQLRVAPHHLEAR